MQLLSRHRLIYGILTVAIAIPLIFWALGMPGIEGHVAAMIVDLQGKPVPCAEITFTPIHIIGPYSGKVRVPMMMTQTNSVGRWVEFNSWPYGTYAVTVFRDRSRTSALTAQYFTIWPSSTTELTFVIDTTAVDYAKGVFCTES